MAQDKLYRAITLFIQFETRLCNIDYVMQNFVRLSRAVEAHLAIINVAICPSGSHMFHGGFSRVSGYLGSCDWSVMASLNHYRLLDQWALPAIKAIARANICGLNTN